MSFPRITRRRFLTLTGGGAVSLLFAACSDESESPDSSGNQTTESDAATHDSEPPFADTWNEPETIASRDGLLEATLVVAPRIVPDGDASRWALTVNGTTPGPALRVRGGDRLKLVLENRSGHTTNLHTHGLHVSPTGNSDNPFIEIPDGESFSYEIAIPEDHPGGLYWYHPHVHHHVAEQLFAGFFGPIIVEDAWDAEADVAAARERLLILHDVRPGNTEAQVMSASMMEMMMGREGSGVYVNGQRQPLLETRTGGLERWRILNASPSRFLNLHLEGHGFHLIGTDVGRLAEARHIESLSLVPGERVEVLVQPAVPGEYRLTTTAVGRGAMGMGPGMAVTSAAAEILTMVVSGDASSGAKLPAPSGALPDLGQREVDGTRVLAFAMQGMTFMIDGRSYDAGRVDIRTALGSVEEWTIRNPSPMDHPFHIHVWPFQVLEQSSGSPPEGWKDVVNVPAGGWVRLRIRFGEIAGKTVYHCHILDHEDMGMMGVIEVT